MGLIYYVGVEETEKQSWKVCIRMEQIATDCSTSSHNTCDSFENCNLPSPRSLVATRETPLTSVDCLGFC
jgi:hypothetical protein